MVAQIVRAWTLPMASVAISLAFIPLLPSCFARRMYRPWAQHWNSGLSNSFKRRRPSCINWLCSHPP
jgi:hypothetical protein